LDTMGNKTVKKMEKVFALLRTFSPKLEDCSFLKSP
jgi:hypothetical protein